MNNVAHKIDIFLQPGDWYFGTRDTRIRTVLGSCISLTFWHPRLLIGGMCHFMVPQRAFERRHCGDASSLDGRYADEAIELLAGEMRNIGAPLREYQVKLFGGGNMFPGQLRGHNSIGQKNIETAHGLISKYGFNSVAEHLGSNGHRNVIFDIDSGNVWMRHVRIQMTDLGAGKVDRRMQCPEYA